MKGCGVAVAEFRIFINAIRVRGVLDDILLIIIIRLFEDADLGYYNTGLSADTLWVGLVAR